MKSLSITLFLLVSLSLNAQQLKGIVYDTEATVKGAKIINSTQHILSYTNDEGVFNISAQPNDTLVFSSLFHHEKTIIVTTEHFKEDTVIELKKITNELDEVEILKAKEKKFDSIVYTEEFSTQINNDYKERPYLYQPPPSGNMDFVAIAKLIGKLFKKKNKTPEIVYAETEDFIHLFETHSFFNSRMLTKELKIPNEYHQLFFDFCSAKNINKALIDTNQELPLLDRLNTLSKEFNLMLKEQQQD